MVCLCAPAKSVDSAVKKQTATDGDVRAVYIRGENSIRVWRQLAALSSAWPDLCSFFVGSGCLARTMKSIEAFSWHSTSLILHEK